MRTIAIGLLGAGNVGAGVVRILQENRQSIERRLDARVEVRKILVRDKTRDRGVALDPSQVTTDVDDVLDDDDTPIIVSLIGGIEPERTWVLEALRRGKHVVTANKALLAEHGRELFEAAAAHGVSVFFEGSVAGGIPILRSLREGLASDRIEALTAIVNGTSNFVLGAMSERGMTYADAVAQAQAEGIAEADPTLDVSGRDAAQKLALLALVSFGVRVDPNAIPTEGIEGIRPFDHAMARRLGYVIKSIARASGDGDALHLAVHPALVPKDHLLATVHGSFNTVLVRSAALGVSLFHGRGAGMMPTGMAVVSDIIEGCRHLLDTAGEGGPPPQAFAAVEDLVLAPVGEQPVTCYLAVRVPNLPGMLGKVATCLGEHHVSVAQLWQDTESPGAPVDMVIITEPAREADVAAALAELDALPDVLAPTQRLRLLTEGDGR